MSGVSGAEELEEHFHQLPDGEVRPWRRGLEKDAGFLLSEEGLALGHGSRVVGGELHPPVGVVFHEGHVLVVVPAEWTEGTECGFGDVPRWAGRLWMGHAAED